MEIIPRSRWGARYSAGFGPSPLPARELWLHHSVTSAPPENATFEQDAASIRVLDDIGQQRFGGGISYTFAVTPSGRIFEGHGVNRQGAHTGGRNDIARAVVLVGDYSTRRPTEAQKRAVAWLVVHGHRQGWWTVTGLSGGHRQAPNQIATACPGDAALGEIPTINRTAADYAAGRINLDQEDDDMQLTDKVKLFNHDTGKVQEYTLQDAFYGIHIHAKEADRKVARVEAKLDALAGTLSNDEANIIAAVRSQPTGGQVDVSQLAAALAPMLPDGVTDVDIEEALANVLRRGTDSTNPTT